MPRNEFGNLGEARNTRAEIEESLEPLFADGLITEVLGIVRKGKEANVYCCRGSDLAGREYVAAKVYRSLEQRGFRNDAEYQTVAGKAGEGRLLRGKDRPLGSRQKRALTNKMHFGREVQSGMWIHSEFDTLQMLHAAGADVPEPLLCSSSAILMEFIGDGAEASPMLARVRMSPEEATVCLRRIIDNVGLWLRCDRVHGDLSAYNVLYREGEIVVIDFPQAVDARFNPNSRRLLERDLENICGHFASAGLHPDPLRIANEMWRRYRVSEL
jgi:RIO kinase 1